ncbi:hypothetical protein ACIU1J_32160 [Azospirillum doebereinerae]|uniref:hypothetical protein n=1 Tax=Azospirillum doebereinerae TaxID=92933 RepID=UPI001EE5DFC7|nr:hypothetical protein [Azospirillum doebereinerae]MCG5238405.1 hypothetical protein [Azospirillum doebereinerae]
MDNVKISIKGNTLTLTVDLSQPGAPSSTGKTLLLASTRGAATIAHPRLAGLKAALNVTVPNLD